MCSSANIVGWLNRWFLGDQLTPCLPCVHRVWVPQLRLNQTAGTPRTLCARAVRFLCSDLVRRARARRFQLLDRVFCMWSTERYFQMALWSPPP